MVERGPNDLLRASSHTRQIVFAICTTRPRASLLGRSHRALFLEITTTPSSLDAFLLFRRGFALYFPCLGGCRNQEGCTHTAVDVPDDDDDKQHDDPKTIRIII